MQTSPAPVARTGIAVIGGAAVIGLLVAFVYVGALWLAAVAVMVALGLVAGFAFRASH